MRLFRESFLPPRSWSSDINKPHYHHGQKERKRTLRKSLTLFYHLHPFRALLIMILFMIVLLSIFLLRWKGGEDNHPASVVALSHFIIPNKKDAKEKEEEEAAAAAAAERFKIVIEHLLHSIRTTYTGKAQVIQPLTTLLDEIQQQKISNLSSSSSSSLSSLYPSQYRAIWWLAFEDPINIDSFTHDTMTKQKRKKDNHSEKTILQRYALAVLYFATNGDNWSRCSRPLLTDTSKTTTTTSTTGGKNGMSPCDDDDDHDHDDTNEKGKDQHYGKDSSSSMSSSSSTSSSSSSTTRFLSGNDACTWYGINCSKNIVTWIDLSNNNLSGTIPDELALLALHDKLELLWLSKNTKLIGTIPPWMNELRNSLQTLSLFDTGMGGKIPEELYELNKLSSLRLYGSQFTGTISPKVGQLTKLSWLWLHGNKFEGMVPTEIGNLKKLEALTIHANNFDIVDNQYPKEICNLRKKKLEHYWTDCSEPKDPNSKTPPSCSCCTRCFPKSV